MKMIELKCLFTKTRIAMNVLGISNTTLAHILGVSADTLGRWFRGTQEPSPLNVYKLNWFIYLVLESEATLDSLLHYYDIAGMTLASNPKGTNQGHFEPWEEEVYPWGIYPYENNIDRLFSNLEKDYDEESPSIFVESNDNSSRIARFINPIAYVADTPDTSSSSDYKPEYDLANVLVNNKNLEFVGNHWLVDKAFNQTLELDTCSYQEAIRRARYLMRLCEVYIDSTYEMVDFCIENFNELYHKVEDFNSFSSVLNEMEDLSHIDERFYEDNTCIELTKYEDSTLKNAIITKKLNRAEISKNHIKLICTDNSVIDLINDTDFIVKPISSHRSLSDYNFMIRYKDEYMVLSIKIGDSD